jgi:excisionase family DNA binding protein
MENVLEKIEELKILIEAQTIQQKEVLNMKDASFYLELSISHLYKLTCSNKIPFYKPNGKKLYFKRAELDEWLLRNRSITTYEIEVEAANYLMRRRFKR